MSKDRHSYKSLAPKPHLKWCVPPEAMEAARNEGPWLRFFKSWKGWVASVLGALFVIGLGWTVEGADWDIGALQHAAGLALFLGSLVFALIRLMNWRTPPKVALYSDAIIIGDDHILELENFAAFGFREVSHGFRTSQDLGLVHKTEKWQSTVVPLGKETDMEKVKGHLEGAGLAFIADISAEFEASFRDGEYDELPATDRSTHFQKRATGEDIAMTAMSGALLIFCILTAILGFQKEDAETMLASVLLAALALLGLWKTIRIVVRRSGEVFLTSEGVVWKKGAKRIEVPYSAIREGGAAGTGLTLKDGNKKILLDVPDGLMEHESFFDEFMKRWQVAIRSKNRDLEKT